MDGVKEMNSTKKKILSTLVEALSCLPYFALSGILFLLLLDKRESTVLTRLMDVLYFIFPFGNTSILFIFAWIEALLLCTVVRLVIKKKNCGTLKQNMLFLFILPLLSFCIFYIPLSCERVFPSKNFGFGYKSCIVYPSDYKGSCNPLGLKFEVPEWLLRGKF